MAIFSMEEEVAKMRGELMEFARMRPQTSEEVIFYLAKAKLILEEYSVAMRLLEKEPYASIRCFEQIHGHVEDYKKRYVVAEEPSLEESDDPWLEDEVDPIPVEEAEEDDDDDFSYFYEEEEEDSFETIVLTDEDGIPTDFRLRQTIQYEDDEGPKEYVALTILYPKNVLEERTVYFCEKVHEGDKVSYRSVKNPILQDYLFKILLMEDDDILGNYDCVGG